MTALIASAAVSQAVHAQEAPSAVAQDTKQVEQAADGMANKVAGWLDKLSDSVRTLGEKSEEWSKDAATYKDQLKEQWPSIKEQFNQKLSEGMEKGQQSKEAVSKWLDVPVLEETGWASPMGLAFNEEGDLFISDNQGWSGAEKAKNKGRVLRLKFENDQLKETITVASGMEHPNGIRIRNGKLYVTQSSLSQIKDPSGLLVSGVYCFDMNDRDIAVTNTSADQNLLTTVITKNPEVQYGLDGIVFNEAGDLFVGNFGDGAIHRIKMDAEGKVVSNDVWAQDTTQLRTTDGMCIDDKGNIWVADFSANAVARVDKDGKIQRIAQSPDCDGSDGGLDQPGEPIVWNGQVIVSCFDLVTGPDKVNTKHDKPFTLAKLSLE